MFSSLHIPGRFGWILGILFFIPSIGSGVENSALFREERWHLREKDAGESVINWTAGFISVESKVPLPSIVFDPDHPDFGKGNTEFTIYDARSRARNQAIDEASLALTRTILSMRLDSSHTVRQMMVKDPEFRTKMGKLQSHFLVKSRRMGDGYVSVELAIPFFKSNGLYSLLTRQSYGTEEVPSLESDGSKDEITGIIIDTTETAGFKPSLEPGIFTDQGRQIFGPEMLHAAYAIHRGPAIYYSDRDRARSDRRLGLFPYHVFAAGVRGSNRSDVFIDSADASRILSSESGREALRKGAVVFIVSSMSGSGKN